MAVAADPVAAGFVPRHASTGGNVTGIAFPAHEMAAKRIDLLKQALPQTREVAVLANARDPAYSQAMVDAMDPRHARRASA